MTPEQIASPGAVCPRCQTTMVARTVRTAIWQGDRVAIVEDIPAHVCGPCMEQFYDDDVSDALRRLTEEGFPVETADKEILVPVFSLNGRIRARKAIPEDSHVE
jgi:YgiT-type zinc finger domain-containing protein